MLLLGGQVALCLCQVILGTITTAAYYEERDVMVVAYSELDAWVNTAYSHWAWAVFLQSNQFLAWIEFLGLSCLFAFHCYLSSTDSSTFLNMGFQYPDEKKDMVLNEFGVTFDRDGLGGGDGGGIPGLQPGGLHPDMVDVGVKEERGSMGGMAAQDEVPMVALNAP